MLLAQGAGGLALVSSVAGYSGLPHALVYGPTKAALINLAETLYLDLQPLGLGVSVVHPGFVQTPLTAQNQFTVLNRIIPTDPTRAIGMNGTIISQLQTGAGLVSGGNVWFYSPGGILLGNGAQFNVGSLLLTTSNVTSAGDGSDEQKAEAFKHTLHAIRRRLDLLVNLPDEKLDAMVLAQTAKDLSRA